MPNFEHLIVERESKTLESVEVDQDRFSDVLNEQLKAHGIEFKKYDSEPEVKTFFEHLPNQQFYAVSIKVGEQHVVFHPTRNREMYFDHTYQSGDDTTITEENLKERVEEPILVIDDLEAFTQKLRDFNEAAKHAKINYHAWSHTGNEISAAENVWFNATPNDFAHPEEFLERYTRIVSNEDMIKLHHKETPRVHSQVLGADFSLTVTAENISYETPYAIMPEIYYPFEDGEATDSVCKVRVGIYEEDGTKKALLCAVQNSHSLKQERESIVTNIEREKIYINRYATLYKTIYQEHKDDFTEVFGQFDEGLFEEEDPVVFYTKFRKQVFENLSEKYKGKPNIENNLTFKYYLRQQYPQYKEVIGGENREYLPSIARGISTLEQLASDDIETLTNDQKDLEKLDQLKGIYNKVGHKMKTEAPPVHAASLAMTLSFLEAQGVTEVKVPLVLPLRVEDHHLRLGYEFGDETDTRKLENLVETIAFVSENAQGVTVWQTESETEDGASYLTIRLGKMSSQKPLVQEMINVGQAASEKH